eukprot:3523635-Prymnesium_polylepis.1
MPLRQQIAHTCAVLVVEVELVASGPNPRCGRALSHGVPGIGEACDEGSVSETALRLRELAL